MIVVMQLTRAISPDVFLTNEQLLAYWDFHLFVCVCVSAWMVRSRMAYFFFLVNPWYEKIIIRGT